MDKTTLENKVFLGNKPKRCKNSNLDCNFGLCDCINPEKEIKFNKIDLRNSTDFKH